MIDLEVIGSRQYMDLKGRYFPGRQSRATKRKRPNMGSWETSILIGQTNPVKGAEGKDLRKYEWVV